MERFAYRAINEQGNTVAGVLDAESVKAANNMLLDRGYIPDKVRKVRDLSFGVDWKYVFKMLNPVKTRDIILFTKQLKSMIQAGVPMMELLSALEDQTENQRFKKIIVQISQDVTQGGLTLCEAFQKHPEAFSDLYCSVVQAGESSGALAEVLDRLIYMIEHENKIISDIKSALRYPLFVLFTLVGAFLFLLMFVIPRFAKIFGANGVELPLPTRICMGMYNMLESYWYLILILCVGMLISGFVYLKTEHGRYARDAVMIRIPMIGKFYIKAAMARFASIFSILQYSGVPVLESMKLLAGAIGNSAISRELKQIKDEIEKGSNIATPLKAARYFTPMVVNMVAIGEKAEKLSEMLNEVAVHYDSEVEYAMKGVSESVSPVLTICIAFVVGFFALAIFLPLWDMIKVK